MGLLDRIRSLGAPATPEDADRLALRQLEGRGADLARPRRVVHFLSTPVEQDARAAAGAARQLGYEVAIDAPAEAGGDWTVRASGERVLDASTLGAFRAAFERIAEETGTTYGGWEAAPKP